MAVPKKKTSYSRKGMRRSHDGLKPSSFIIDKKTNLARRNHHIGPDGTYNGMQVIEIKDKSVVEE